VCFGALTQGVSVSVGLRPLGSVPRRVLFLYLPENYRRMHIRSLLVVGVILLGIGACTGKRMAGQRPVKHGADTVALALPIGETVFLEREGLHVTFSKVLEDSRCPQGVACVWAGVAAVEITVMGTYTRPQTFVLATTALPAKGYGTKQTFNDLQLAMAGLEPRPMADDSASIHRKYVLRLLVSGGHRSR
jgi:hypothetical protein